MSNEEIEENKKKAYKNSWVGRLTKYQMDWRPIECYQQPLFCSIARLECENTIWQCFFWQINTNQLMVRSSSWKGSSSGYLSLCSFGHLLLSDVIWLVVEEEVKRLLTLVQPVGNLVMKLFLCFGDLPSLDIWGARFLPIIKRPSKTHPPGLTDQSIDA